MFAIRKMQRQPGSFKEHMIVKTFKSSEAMHAFLNTGMNALQWSEVKPGMPDKAGTYAYVGGEWRNTRSLDPYLLAHV